jgi:manganese/zinc/iron transport system permease protein
MTGWTLFFDGWIIAIAATCATACALPGCFLVLRRMSLMGDAISHAVLPGIAIGFLLTGSRSNGIMFAGAIVAGFLTAFFSRWLKRFGRVDQGAAMGVVFTTLFALGLLLIVRGANSVELDPSCVLYGALEFAPLDLVTVPFSGGLEVPRSFFMLSVVLLLDLLLILALFKTLRIASFDPSQANAQGMRPELIHHLLMAMTAITTVAAFEAVGSIIVVAMIVVPAVVARLFIDRLGSMLLLAVVIAILSAGLGHLAAVELPHLIGYGSVPTSGMIAIVGGILLVIGILVNPRQGVLPRFVRRWRFRLQTTREDLLALAWRLEERGTLPTASILSHDLMTARRVSRLETEWSLRRLLEGGSFVSNGDELQLTVKGRLAARDLVRSHRLWEAWLTRTLGIAPDHVHDTAMRLEHVTDEAMRERLATETGSPDEDPHGRSIPE